MDSTPRDLIDPAAPEPGRANTHGAAMPRVQRRGGRLAAVLAITGAAGLVAAGSLLALDLADNSADHVAFASGEQAGSKDRAATPAATPSYEETLSAVAWATRHASQPMPADVMYLVQSVGTPSPPAPDPAADTVGITEGKVITYTVTFGGPDLTLPATVATDSRLARAMIEAMERSTCGGTPSGLVADATGGPPLIWLQCPNGTSRETATLDRAYAVVKVTGEPSTILIDSTVR